MHPGNMYVQDFMNVFGNYVFLSQMFAWVRDASDGNVGNMFPMLSRSSFSQRQFLANVKLHRCVYPDDSPRVHEDVFQG
jgi:hypothetical protein